MLSTTADYALRAILVLARNVEERSLRADEIADAMGAPRNYMAKTLNALAKAGVVTSARGPLGGFCLARSAAGLTIAEVVDLFEERRPPRHCLLDNRPCDQQHPCNAHHRWADITAARRAPFASTTVADLLAG
jgi:Rrf2 family protein